MSEYGFLIDRDVAKVASLFPAKRTRTTLDLGLPANATDAAIVEKAWDRQLIIVTANGDDFVREFHRFLSKTQKKDCRDLFGLLILPSGFEIQKRVLSRVKERMRFGGKPVIWADIWYKNYCVRVLKDSKVEITRFPQCLYCRKLQQTSNKWLIGTSLLRTSR